VVHKRSLIVRTILAAALVLLFIAGCEIISNIESELGITAPLESTTSIPIVETSQPLSETPPPEETRELTLVVWVPPQFAAAEDNPGGKALIDRLAAFELENPGLKVEVRVKSLEGNGSLLSSLATTTAAAPEALPGLILLNRSDFETAALKGLIFPISSRALEYHDPDYFPFVIDMTSFQGVQYGLPLFFDPLVLAYNSRLIAFPPRTWQDLISQDDVAVFNINDPDAPIPFAVYLSNGGKLINTEGNPVLEAAPLTRTYQFFFNGSNNNVFPAWMPDLKSAKDSLHSLTTGQALYAITWASQALGNLSNNLNITAAPSSTTDPVTLVDGWMLCITNPTVERSKYDLMLADYLLQPEFLAKWSESTGYLPAQRSVLEQWEDQGIVETLSLAASQSVSIPSNEIQQYLGSILNQYTISLVRRQTNPMQAVSDSLANLENQ
jgi:ABC-type glycerol-3-phosphate transport system substrate-binding protein